MFTARGGEPRGPTNLTGVQGPPSSSFQQNPLRVRVLRSGSAGNAILVEAGETRFLIDAGLPGETILKELDADGLRDGASPGSGSLPGLTAILLTHEHDDHLKGAAAVARATGAVVLANEPTMRAAGTQLAGADVQVFRTDAAFRVGPVAVTAFRLPHDAAEPVGFVLSHAGTRAAVACDLGEVTDELVERACGVDLFVVEANYDLRLMAVSAYPWFLKNRIIGTQGHLSNEGAARAAAGIASDRLQAVFLVHLSEVNNLAPLARDTVGAALDAAGMCGVQVEAIRPNAGGPWWAAPLVAPAHVSAASG